MSEIKAEVRQVSKPVSIEFGDTQNQASVTFSCGCKSWFEAEIKPDSSQIELTSECLEFDCGKHKSEVRELYEDLVKTNTWVLAQFLLNALGEKPKL
jgi:hypothetical protein